jgi:uncharacterized protein (TIGR02271 family)
MSAMTDAYEWQGRTVVGADGEKIGKIDEIYIDNATGDPEWALVNTGLFGTKSNFVPLETATPSGGNVAVQVTKDEVSNAPSVDTDAQLTPEEEQMLYRHYGLEFGDFRYADAETGTVGHDTSGPTTDDAMTRSEEELAVGTRSVESGRVRLRKYVVTENVTQTVPVQREEVRIEREPITDANVDAATDGPAISDEEHEVVLHQEEVVSEKRAVPKERVRLDKDVVTEEAQVSEEVRKEQIEVDSDQK